MASVGGFVEDLDGLVNGPAFVEADDVAAAGGGDPFRAFADGCLEGLAIVRRAEAALAAVKVRLVDGHVGAVHALEDPAADPGWAKGQEAAVVAEVACVLTIGERAAGSLIGASHALTSSLPAALDALQAGAVPWQNAQIIVDETAGLGADATAALEARFLGLEGTNPDAPAAISGGIAGELPPARLRRRVRSWRERHQPESIEKRHARGVADRRMEYSPDRDGMAWVSLCLPADQANAAWNRTRALARGLQSPDEPRTLPQLMADIGAAALLSTGADAPAGTGVGCGPGADAKVAGELAEVPALGAQVLVTVPVFALLGLTDEPAVLDGHGPVPASMARQLVADGAASFYRVLVDPRDGAPLEIGRTSYRIPVAMRRWLRLRDGKCPFPGCSNNSLDNEVDHLLAWHHGGATGISNLGQLCPKHHRMKHTSGWEPTPATKNRPPGYVSPFGRSYTSEHQDWEPPHLPQLGEGKACRRQMARGSWQRLVSDKAGQACRTRTLGRTSPACTPNRPSRSR
ncbi:HNH endonuclease [Arthrobacter nitrophenolicus]|uniref:HNH endonuclease n=1 Tax=Arthrobacter nitrophenolicus TaxID=683150 RepID=L8TJK0_9MICC|nr:HNH endonuclease [Arthrobacter nitrophenolicus]